MLIVKGYFAAVRWQRGKINDSCSQNSGKYWVKVLWRKFPNGWIETGKSFSDVEPTTSLQKQKQKYT